MPVGAWIMLLILVGMFALLVKTKIPPWMVFLGTLAVTMTFRLAPEQDLLRGFVNSGVITVGMLFIVAAGMYSTGAITFFIDKLVGYPNSIGEAQARILPSVATASAFLNAIPLVAMMIPIIRNISQTSRLAASWLYLPVRLASILGGASTLIGTSTNLIVAGMVAEQIARNNPLSPPMQEIGIFLPSVVGVPVALIGLAFIITFTRRLLPKAQLGLPEHIPGLKFRAEFLVEAESLLVGKTIEQAGVSALDGCELDSLWHKDEIPLFQREELSKAEKPRRRFFQRLTGLFSERAAKSKHPQKEPDRLLRAGDLLTFTADIEGIAGLWTRVGLTPYGRTTVKESERSPHRLVEVVVSPESPVIGWLVAELPAGLNIPDQAQIVAISRSGNPPPMPIQECRIQAGDIAILEVEDSFFYENRGEQTFRLLKPLRGYRIQRSELAVTATLITVTMVLLASFSILSILNAALLAVVAMVATGCLSPSSAWRSIEFDTLVVLGIAIGLEAAITATGLSAAIAGLIGVIGGNNPYIALALIFIGCIILTNLTANAATVALMFPIALAIAGHLGVNFTPFAIILMLGTSYAFINPTINQANKIVYESGGYQYVDFVNLGLPLTVLVGSIVIIMAPRVYGF